MLLELDAEGAIRSQVFPGLWLAVMAMLQGEMTKVLLTLQAGLNSREHALVYSAVVSDKIG